MQPDNMEMFKLQARLTELDSELRTASGRRSGGAAAILIAILGTLFFVPLVVLWIPLGIVGILTWITNAGKVGTLKKERKQLVDGV